MASYDRGHVSSNPLCLEKKESLNVSKFDVAARFCEMISMVKSVSSSEI